MELSFMNKYHTNGDLGYADSLKRTEWTEHAVHWKKIQTAGQDTPDDTSDDVYEYEFAVEGGVSESDNNKSSNDDTNKYDFKKTDLKFRQFQIKQMISDDIVDSTLAIPEDMLNNRFNKFARYGYLDPVHELVTGTREYLFFSKPDLHLVNVDSPGDIYDAVNTPFFREAFLRYKLSYYSLQQSFGGNSSLTVNGLKIDLRNKYINLLSNMVTSSFDLSDISASDVMNNQNLYQINTSYREGSITSDLQYDFSLEFKDTKYLDVYMLFKIYDEYFRQKYMAEIEPTRLEYIKGRIYPEALSIWKVITDDTGRIMYWAKATGCTPMSVPRGTISNIEGNIKFTINWKAQFVKDMDPMNLLELNYLTARSLGITSIGKHKNLTDAVLNGDNVKIMGLVEDKDENKKYVNKQTWAGYPLVVTSRTHRTGHNYKKDEDSFHRLIWVQ